MILWLGDHYNMRNMLRDCSIRKVKDPWPGGSWQGFCRSTPVLDSCLTLL